RSRLSSFSEHGSAWRSVSIFSMLVDIEKRKKGFTPTPVLPSRFVATLSHYRSQVFSKLGVIEQGIKNAMQQGQNRCGGFTLTELIVTLSIVAVIATVVISGQSGYTDGIALS